MTKVNFFRRNGVFYGFEEIGHTGYGESGEDILCAALSSMTMLLVSAAEIGYASDIDYVIDEEKAKVTVTAMGALPEFAVDEKKQFALAGLFTGYFYQLNDLTEEYYEYLSVDVIDTDAV
jgi:hypothetical protein